MISRFHIAVSTVEFLRTFAAQKKCSKKKQIVFSNDKKYVKNS